MFIRDPWLNSETDSRHGVVAFARKFTQAANDMKAVRLTSIMLLFAGAHLNAQTFLTDDFSGGSLDTGKWRVVLNAPGASVVQSGGVVTTTNRGVLATVEGFTAPYVVSGSFTMLDGNEHFNVGLRTDLSTDGAASSYELASLIVTFINDSDAVSIQEFTTASSWNQVATTGVNGFSFTTGQSYSFAITDTGTSVSVSIDGNFVLGANSTFSTGDKVGFYSREFGAGTQIESLTISAVPEPGDYAAIVGLIGLIVVAKVRVSVIGKHLIAPRR